MITSSLCTGQIMFPPPPDAEKTLPSLFFPERNLISSGICPSRRLDSSLTDSSGSFPSDISFSSMLLRRLTVTERAFIRDSVKPGTAKIHSRASARNSRVTAVSEMTRRFISHLRSGSRACRLFLSAQDERCQLPVFHAASGCVR